MHLYCTPNNVLGKFVLRRLEFHVVPSNAHYTKPDLTIASCLLPRSLLVDARGSVPWISEIAPSCD